MFETDLEDGSLEVLATGPLPLEAVASAKSLAHWLTTGVPLTAMAPLLGLLLNLQPEAYGVLMLSMLAGTPAISALGAIGAALTPRLASRRAGLVVRWRNNGFSWIQVWASSTRCLAVRAVR